MSRLDELLEKRQQVASWYDERLAKIPGVNRPVLAPTTTRASWFVYIVRFDDRIDRNKVANLLAERNIPTRPYFTPIHLQKYMRQRFGYSEGDYPSAEKLGKTCLALPFSGVMTEESIETVCEAIRSII
jgi:perosamine synthetase